MEFGHKTILRQLAEIDEQLAADTREALKLKTGKQISAHLTATLEQFHEALVSGQQRRISSSVRAVRTAVQHTRKGEKENMKKMIQKAKQSGQSLVEYGLVLALIAIVAILVVKAVGTKTASTFDNIQSTMTSQGVASTTPQSASS